MLIIGSALAADWQTFREDPCKVFSTFHYRDSDYNRSSSSCEKYKSATLHQFCMEMETDGNWTGLAMELCQATQGCHWNQFSVISGAFCINCPDICRSVHQSLSIIQYSFGALMFAFALPAIETCGWILLTNNLQDHEQV